MPNETGWDELYRKYETKRPDNIKGKLLILAVVVFSAVLIVFFYATRQTSQTAECGTLDGVCPDGCDYTRDGDCEKTTETTTATKSTTVSGRSCDEECRYIGYEYGKCASADESISCNVHFVSIGEVESCRNCCCKVAPAGNDTVLA